MAVETVRVEVRLTPAPDDTAAPKPRFTETWCSQCGASFGPGNHGYSHCIDPQPPRAWPAELDRMERAQSGDAASLETQRAAEAWDRIMDLTRDLPEPLRFDIRATVVAYGTALGLRVAEDWKASVAERHDLHGLLYGKRAP